LSVLVFLAATDAAAQQAEDPAKAEKKVCRSERVTGSLARVNKICMTKAEWDRLARETRKDLEDIQRNAGAVPRTINPEASNMGGMTAGTG
jgi:hypothetical protein